MPTPRPTVLLADDHPMNTALLRSLLLPSFEVVGDVADGRALIAEAERLSPDVIVTDIGMPGVDGIEAARCILARNPRVRIVFVTVYNDLDVVRTSLATGALGYVVKLVAGDELVSAVHAALRGERHVAGVSDSTHPGNRGNSRQVDPCRF